MVEWSLGLSFSLLLITLGVVILYFWKMRKISEEYVEAKNVLGDIILSFRADIQREEDHVHSLAQRVDDLTLRAESLRKIDELRAELTHVQSCIREMLELNRNLSIHMDDLTKKIEELSVRGEENSRKISELEELRRRQPTIIEKIEAAVPIRGDRVLAQLTETELRVLSILASEGEKTASQIREKINLTREHTARLMKTLYTRGYVERTTDNLPYVYRIKDEMMEVLKRAQENVS